MLSFFSLIVVFPIFKKLHRLLLILRTRICGTIKIEVCPLLNILFVTIQVRRFCYVFFCFFSKLKCKISSVAFLSIWMSVYCISRLQKYY